MAQMDKEERVERHFPECGPDILSKEVARPERLDVAGQKPVPIADMLSGGGMKIVLEENVFVPRHNDSKLHQFTWMRE
ncbi:MAG: hypothetical protein OHK005_21090 [Candidatus Methylacidiphilales bacterium]